MAKSLEFNQIRAILPYSPPLLLVDKVIDWEKDKWIEVEKVVSGSDPLVYSHLLKGPQVLPGVILIEFVGQAGLLLQILSGKNFENDFGTITFLAKCKADFLKPALVGELLKGKIIKVATVQNKTLITGEIFSSDKIICKVELYSATINN